MQSRARDLFYGLWVNDLFMKRVEANADWSLFCPHEAPGLADVWGDKFVALYQQYEREGRHAVLGGTLAEVLAGNGYIVGINQIYDVEIDTVNKPFLPVAAGARPWGFLRRQARQKCWAVSSGGL